MHANHSHTGIRTLSLLLATIFGLSACQTSRPTQAGDPGRWSTIKRCLAREYGTDIQTTHEAGRRYLRQRGFAVTTDQIKGRSSLLRGTRGQTKSMTLRSRRRRRGLTSVELKVGPDYRMGETIAMMDEYQMLLPPAARPQ